MPDRPRHLSRLLLTTVLACGGIATAHAGTFLCSAYIGANPPAPTATNTFAMMDADTRQEAESLYLASFLGMPISARGVHNLSCSPR